MFAIGGANIHAEKSEPAGKNLDYWENCVYKRRVRARSPFMETWEGEKMAGARCVRVNIMLTEETRKLLRRAIAGGRYGGASEYVRALIVKERRRSGDPEAKGALVKLREGRPRKVA
jgi:hypothetical protein